MAPPTFISSIMSGENLIRILYHKSLNCNCYTPLLLHIRSSQWWPIYQQPIIDKEELKTPLPKDDERNFLPIKAAKTEDHTFSYYDPVVNKFTNIIMLKGKKSLARDIMMKTFEQIKRIQIEKYNKASEEEKENILCNPVTIFHQAIENCKPLLLLENVKRGAIVYQVPVPITDRKSQFVAMKWMRDTCRDKYRTVHMEFSLAEELINAANHTGRVIKKKQDLHKLAEANRAYAHFRYGK